jgi:hypothetical protein
MSESSSGRSFGSRLGRAIANLFLALLNATLLLFIVAVVVGLVFLVKAESLTADLAANVTRAAVASTGLNPPDTLAELRVVSTEMIELRTAIEEHRDDVDAKVAALDARLDGLQTTISTLRAQKIAMTETTIDRISAAVGATLNNLRHCKPDDAGS